MTARAWTYPQALSATIRSGVVLVGGDGHFWPGDDPTIWRAFCALSQLLRPQLLVLNGDMIDGTRISRHGRLRGQNAPTVLDEIGAARTRFDELPKKIRKIWTMGNHDQRVDTYIANMAPELDDFCGRLDDRFPDVEFCWSALLNEEIEIRHRFRGGIHTAYNNALHAGRTMVSNHTHQLEVKSIVNRQGRRWGVETGMLNDPNAPQFEYTEGQPTRWTAGFAVLTFDERGQMLPPELCEMQGPRAVFRGRCVAEDKPKSRKKARA